MPSAIEAKPTVSEMRAPQIVRLNMSRDNWSVPNQNSREGAYGGRSPATTNDFSGSLSGSHGARMRGQDDDDEPGDRQPEPETEPALLRRHVGRRRAGRTQPSGFLVVLHVNGHVGHRDYLLTRGSIKRVHEFDDEVDDDVRRTPIITIASTTGKSSRSTASTAPDRDRG